MDNSDLFSRLASMFKGYDGTAAEAPGRHAIRSRHGDRTFAELNARIHRGVRALDHAGLVEGDAVALLCSNRAEFVEALFSAERGGYRLTPINWHFSEHEVQHIVEDSGARALIADARFADVAAAVAKRSVGLLARFAVGGEIEGFVPFEEVLAKESPEPVAPRSGGLMLYTSGTTGRPKGVRRDNPSLEGLRELPIVLGALRPQPGDVALCTGPLYHGANIGPAVKLPIMGGLTVVLMDGFDAEEALRLIAEHRVTIAHMVPIMMQRLLALNEATQKQYDISSLRFLLHGGAPCPVGVKRALIEWLGPVVYEYYGATEGFGTFIGPDEALRKPGSVGRADPLFVSIRDEDRKVVPIGSQGNIYLATNASNRFVYHNDDAKTEAAFDGEWFTLGDVGKLDEDGYLFICDRSADVIISGGVNIYPAEVDAVLVAHSAVQDVATFGIPDSEWGETVGSVVELKSGYVPSDALAREIIDFCRASIAGFKCPRTLDFVARLPRDDSGKSCRRLLRDQYRTRVAGASQ